MSRCHFEYADALWRQYRFTGNTDTWCLARAAERDAFNTLAKELKIISSFSDWPLGVRFGNEGLDAG